MAPHGHLVVLSPKALSSWSDSRSVMTSFELCNHGQQDALCHLSQLLCYASMVSMMPNPSQPADVLCHHGQHDALHLLGQHGLRHQGRHDALCHHG